MTRLLANPQAQGSGREATRRGRVKLRENLLYVMKNGELRDADTLDELWPGQKKLPRQYWWDLEPNTRKGAPARPSVSRPLAPTTR